MPAAGNFRGRIWFHGTTKRSYQEMLRTKVVNPFLADQEEFGEAIWLTSDPQEASTYGPYIICITNELARKYRLERFSGIPHGNKKLGLVPGNLSPYHMVIKDPVPLKHWKLYNIKTGGMTPVR